MHSSLAGHAKHSNKQFTTVKFYTLLVDMSRGSIHFAQKSIKITQIPGGDLVQFTFGARVTPRRGAVSRAGSCGAGDRGREEREMCRLRAIRSSSIFNFCKEPAPKHKTRRFAPQTCCVLGLKAKIKKARTSNSTTYVTFPAPPAPCPRHHNFLHGSQRHWRLLVGNCELYMLIIL